MTRIEQAQSVVEFAKANGFQGADLWFWEPEGDGAGHDGIKEIMLEYEQDKPVEIGLTVCLGVSKFINRDNGRKDECDPDEPALDIEELP